MSTNTFKTKIIAFARQVGLDYKELKALIEGINTNVNTHVTSEYVQGEIRKLKGEILGGAPAETLDTIKELADALTSIKDDTTLAGQITSKYAELSAKITPLETFKTEIEGLDPLQTYTTAKTGV